MECHTVNYVEGNKDLNLFKLILKIEHSSKTKNVEAFKGIGKIKRKCRVHLKDNAIPSVSPSRKIALALKN